MSSGFRQTWFEAKPIQTQNPGESLPGAMLSGGWYGIYTQGLLVSGRVLGTLCTPSFFPGV